MGDNIMIDI